MKFLALQTIGPLFEVLKEVSYLKSKEYHKSVENDQAFSIFINSYNLSSASQRSEKRTNKIWSV